ncbi:MAG: hypothetical protein NZ781_12345 [Armatimonadetes bacterium]|nr:hypothetical protein [Armatimonadota bacterium]
MQPKSLAFDEGLAGKYAWLFAWFDSPQNPLIEAPEKDDWVADPTVLSPKESNDGKWHLLCSGKGIKHFVSNDGINWVYEGLALPEGYSPFLFKDGGTFWLFYQVSIGRHRETAIVCRPSKDFRNWGERQIVLVGEKDWERGIYGEPYVRNPCIVKVGNEYWLYYSGGYILLPDTGYEEPSFVCLARSKFLLGPYEKHSQPLISPSLSDRWRNLGAGAMKVYKLGEIFVGFNNGIYWAEDLHSHSAIHILLSYDGVSWFDAPQNPIIAPTGEGWKKSHVYQMDCKIVSDELWMFYNARDGWTDATERIGLAICKMPSYR